MTHSDYFRLRHARRKRIPGQVSEWKPTFIDNLVFWLDASKIKGLSNGEQVTIWDDWSGQNNHAVSASGSATYHSNAVNGLPAVSFDGNGYMATTDSLPGGSSHLAIFAVIYPLDDTNRAILGWGEEDTRKFSTIGMGSRPTTVDFIGTGITILLLTVLDMSILIFGIM